MTLTSTIVLTAVAFTPHCCPVVEILGPPRASVQLSNALDAANRCTRLPATPSSVTLQLGGTAPLTDGTVHLRLASDGDDDEQLLVVAASSASVAISRACRELVREHGLRVAAIDVGVREAPAMAAPLRRALLATQRWRLLATYGVRPQFHAAVEALPDEQRAQVQGGIFTACGASPKAREDAEPDLMVRILVRLGQGIHGRQQRLVVGRRRFQPRG